MWFEPRGLMVEEDSPGNYTLREGAEGFECDWYDNDGGENVIPLFRLR
jgi:hypothetical protein